MSSSPLSPSRAADACSRAALILALLLLAAAFFLISPPAGQTYPGAKPWSDLSILRPLTGLMSLGGLLASVRGVEIKDFAFHLAAALGLLLLATRALLAPWPLGAGPRGPTAAGPRKYGPATYAQLLLVGWVLLSLLSSLWSDDPATARKQALLYALGLAWAIAVASTLRRRHLPALLYGVMVIAALGAALGVWYYHERNPYHRPGFPIGNPIPLAAAILPGILIAAAVLVGTGWQWTRGRRMDNAWPALASLLALVPLVWCGVLTQGRGALVALLVGLAAMGVFLVGRRLRWALTTVLLAGFLVVATWWYSTSHLDLAMARGATMRFRLYAWRYAVELWGASSFTQIAGHGAGAYPRLAGAHAVDDRALDPAAFMGEIIEHAHNELFEVLTEIGLVGGVTYVGGLVATVLAASALLRAARPGPRRWLLFGLVGSVAALLADSMTGVALRLPGGAPIFYTLLGALWALCRGDPDCETNQTARRARFGALATALLLALAAAGALRLAIGNWRGVTREYAAQAAFDRQEYQQALDTIRRAETELLDPVRVVIARQLALRSRLGLAAEAVSAWSAQATTAPGTDRWQPAVDLAQQAYQAALALARVAPALLYTDATAARSAEWLGALYGPIRPRVAGAWTARAEYAWRRQRERTPYDVETLLALTRYRASLESHVALLRDALRSGQPYGGWLDSLNRLANVPGSEQALTDSLAMAGPISAETDVDAIIASRAPETHRMFAAWRALRGEFAAAAAHAAHAAGLYEPMRPRFPTLRSVALTEQADYVLRQTLDAAPLAVDLIEEAISALPTIQKQKYEEMAAPFRFRLAFCLLAAGRADEAAATMRLALGPQGDDPEVVAHVLRRLVDDAAATGFPAKHIERIRQRLGTTPLPSREGQEEGPA